MKKAVAILGAGAWGTALAYFFGSKGYAVFLWCHEQEVAASINEHSVNTAFLKGVVLPRTVYASTDIHNVLSRDVDFVVEAVPVAYLGLVLEKIDRAHAVCYNWVLTSKGLDAHTGVNALDIMHHLFGSNLKTVVLGGPSFASDLVQGVPTACVAATPDKKMYDLFVAYWTSDCTRLYYSEDSVGVLLCGALKNMVALLLGLLDGSGCGKNTQAFFLTLAFNEIKRVVALCGGKEQTVEGLAGFGDLFLTASSIVSKNRMYGYLIGQSKTEEEVRKHVPVLPEGFFTAKGFHVLCKSFNISVQKDFPVLASIYPLLAGHTPVNALLKQFFGVGSSAIHDDHL